MDPSTVSYYRAILFRNAEEHAPLPPGLVELHNWTVKRHQALGLGPIVQKNVALTVSLIWLSSTVDGRDFAQNQTSLGDMFADPATVPEVHSDIEWDKIAKGTRVVCELQNGKTKEGSFIGVRGSWIDVVIEGQKKNFRTNKVVLASSAQPAGV